jgi:CheY-like chemotaxis protein
MADDRPAVILHVEDDPTNRALLRAVLARAPEPAVRAARLHEAQDLAAARAFLADRTPDVILLDVRLPDGSGLDLARELRDAAPDPHPTVIVMSASVLASERHAAIEAGADRFLAKPYAPAQLMALISTALGGDG